MKNNEKEEIVIPKDIPIEVYLDLDQDAPDEAPDSETEVLICYGKD